MDKHLLETLLYDEEGSSLDFKRDQYPFVRATDEQKSELLKDILAFANSLRHSPAYILISVDEVRGGRSKPVGVAEHLNDAELQQFVKSKVNRTILFSYEAATIDGKQVGVIRVEVQERFSFITRDFGKLRKNVVYMRQGSSTFEVDPNEIYGMGRAEAQVEATQAVLDIDFADPTQRLVLGKALQLQSQPLRPLDESEVPSFSEGGGMFHLVSAITSNDAYFDELNNFMACRSFLHPVRFVVSNLAGVAAQDVRMEASILKEEGLFLIEESRFPLQPRTKRDFSIKNIPTNLTPASSPFPSTIAINSLSDRWILEALFRKIRPKEKAWSNGVFYIGTFDSRTVSFQVQIFAENLHSPLDVPMTIEMECAPAQPITIEMLRAYHEDDIANDA